MLPSAIVDELSDDETDNIERLSTLNIPGEGVSLVPESQPGSHLDPVLNRREKDVHSYEIPSWDRNDVIELARLHGVDHALWMLIAVAGHTDMQLPQPLQPSV